MSPRAVAARLAGRRRPLLLGGAGLVALVLVFAATQLLGGGGGEDPFTDLPDVVAAGAVPSPGSTPPAPPEHDHPVETAGLRDPFCPLVAPGAPACPAPAPPAPAPAPPAPGQPMTLLDVFADGGHLHARVRVGPTVYTRHVNDTFDAYKVASLSDRCGEFLRGEERRSLCEGEEWAAD